MGNLTSMLRSLFQPFNKEKGIVMIGLDAAGKVRDYSRLLSAKNENLLQGIVPDPTKKTTILYRLKLGEVITSIPTVGFNVETVNFKKVTLKVWDIGGQDKIRPLWKYYYNNSDAIVFVVDSNDPERLGEAAHELRHVLASQELAHAPLLILSNKQDLPNSMDSKKIVSGLQLESVGDRKWHVQPTNAVNGDGLYEGLNWLCSVMDN